jgi:hypothetical protein
MGATKSSTPNTLKRKILPTDEAETVVLSASELRKWDPSLVEVKMIKWSGTRLGHIQVFEAPVM